MTFTAYIYLCCVMPVLNAKIRTLNSYPVTKITQFIFSSSRVCVCVCVFCSFQNNGNTAQIQLFLFNFLICALSTNMLYLQLAEEGITEWKGSVIALFLVLCCIFIISTEK